MVMNLKENTVRNERIMKEISTILDDWRGIYSKANTAAAEENKKCFHRRAYVSNEDYSIECICRAEGKAALRTVFDEYIKPLEKNEFVRIQKNTFLKRVENDCRRLAWYLEGITTCHDVYPLVDEVQYQIANIDKLLGETLEEAWEEHKMAFELVTFCNIKKDIQIRKASYEPADALGRRICGTIGIKTYEYDISSAVHALEVFMEDISEEADRIAQKAVDDILTRKIVEPIKFILNVM